jgi:hypothetical protein
MNKSSFFTGQPIFTQLLSLVPKSIITKAARAFKSDRYYKKFDTYHHLITMLYATYQHCTSLREVVSGMQACEGRLQSLGICHLPARSTLSEANSSRKFDVFEYIYLSILKKYSFLLPDSPKDNLTKRLVIIDSTTISLFKEILKNVGERTADGRRKGGIKVHMAVRSNEDVPYLVRFSAAANNDVLFLKHIHLPPGSVIVMDRGYSNFSKYNEWTKNKVNWVTRLSSHNVYTVLEDVALTTDEAECIISDQKILLGIKSRERVKCRLVKYFDISSNRVFSFLTNNFRWSASKVAAIYKRRWQIEQLFKRLKQNMPLHYFLGDNENAIKIQIYCALIADLLLKIATKGIKRQWAFSNLASIVRLHLMNYTHLRHFLEHPDRARVVNPIPQSSTSQLQILFSG